MLLKMADSPYLSIVFDSLRVERRTEKKQANLIW